MKKVDPDSEEEYWATIKHTKVQIPVPINGKGEVNSPPSEPHLKVVCISDTHNQLDLVKNIPDGDVLIHAGDLTNYGSEEELKKVNSELALLPHKHKLIVAGNHDLGFDDSEDLNGRLKQYRGHGTPQGYNLLENVTWLHEKGVEIDGVKFFGSSWHPLYGYPFYRPRPELKEKWKVLPSDLDVLITHTPALGYLDTFGDERWGCRYLLKEIEERVKPKFHIFGHVHERYGALSNGQTVSTIIYL
ncbi:Ser/Thr phosphatase family protein [Oesophagostomum dentatum]|uniref:Ser/Thr phosphatase family protein n=1 Tax=Oesophagostomum dentatum TaxID=61180 RepID=A0A0B1T0A3_OESDE|nr:Ser/Thr phosphatase family protein [Oesophagostomum dentatum]